MSTNLRTGRYLGANPGLQMCRALLRDDAEPGFLLAQFDNVELVVNGIHYGLGWRPFPATDFILEPEDAPTTLRVGDSSRGVTR